MAIRFFNSLAGLDCRESCPMIVVKRKTPALVAGVEPGTESPAGLFFVFNMSIPRFHGKSRENRAASVGAAVSCQDRIQRPGG